MNDPQWETLDLVGTLESQREQHTEATVGSNVGSFVVPLGPMLRQPDLTGAGAQDDFKKQIPREYWGIYGLE